MVNLSIKIFWQHLWRFGSKIKLRNCDKATTCQTISHLFGRLLSNVKIWMASFRQTEPRTNLLNVAFFRKCDSFFKSPNLQKKIFQKTILNLKFKLPAHNSIILWAGILTFKYRIVFWNIFFWRLGYLKNEWHFRKKATFSSNLMC
jgi:hypothetical protein